MKNDVQERKVLYAAVWRWHFYAGLYVAPFLMLLAVTGLVMLAKEPIERWQFGALLTNTSGAVLPRTRRDWMPLDRRFPMRRSCATSPAATAREPLA